MLLSVEGCSLPMWQVFYPRLSILVLQEQIYFCKLLNNICSPFVPLSVYLQPIPHNKSD